VIPVVTVEEMQAIDAEAAEPVDVLVSRAGQAVARAALDMLDGGYGRRVVAVCGPGNNGADGRYAARVLRRRGVRVHEVDAIDPPTRLPRCDLVVDAAFGTGLVRAYEAPDPGGAPVLAVDIPSGVRGDTGACIGSPVPARRTVTFAALKPGLLFGAGAEMSGDVEVVDIGLDVSRAKIHVVDHGWVAGAVPPRPRDAHKWKAAVLVVAGSPRMSGAAAMSAAAAQRGGAGMVVVAAPGVAGRVGPVETVSATVEEAGWSDTIIDGNEVDTDRMGAAVVGPGLGTSMATRHEVRRFLERAPMPVVVDGDGLTALGRDAGPVFDARDAATVLTPHDGEFARLSGSSPGEDRIAAARDLAADTGAVVLLKGPTTVIASPRGRVRLVTAGDERLATAGTGDVLTGLIAALAARGMDGFDAASAGAHVHGVAGSLCPAPGTIASDVVEAVPSAFARILQTTGPVR
jgi:ADP-dependent NAD(P)H-hydrate dehydratase / NAD(P)H-hydrate epimerase